MQDIFFPLRYDNYTEMERVRIGVIGVGHLGSAHLKNLITIDEVELIGLYDIDHERADEVASLQGTVSFDSQEELLNSVDAVSIVTPTSSHFEVAMEALNRGKSIFVEKPICDNVEDARTLVKAAEGKNCMVQVGHIERFSGTYRAFDHSELDPMFIECHRLMEFQPRNVDVAVVLDLMIHDIDLVLHMTGSKPVTIDANGVSVITDNVDIANARLTFANGCVANLTASRISQKGMRKMRIFEKNSYITLDFLKNETRIFKISSADSPGNGLKVSQIQLNDEVKNIYLNSPKVVDDNPLLTELNAFVHSVQTGEKPPVTGEDGLAALEVALKIISVINKE